MTDEIRSYSTIEVAKRLGVSLQTIQRWVDSGHLKAWKTLGGHRRIDAGSAQALFDARSNSVRGGTGAPPEGRRVLVVDDNPLDLELTVNLVRRILPDATVDEAGDGFQALVSIGRSVPDVLITDLTMPHMDGFEMIRSLQAGDAPRPPTIVAVSSLPPSEMRRLGRGLPGVTFLSKPIDEEQLAKSL